MANRIIPAKLLLCLLGRGRGEQIMTVSKAAGARGGTIALCRTLGDNPILRALALADVNQDIVFTLLGPEFDNVVAAITEAAAANPKKFKGYAFIVDVAGILARGCSETQPRAAQQEYPETTAMQHPYELITIIVNSGYADDVMAAARKAGATGGTILNARGTGTEEDVKFFGISLVPEKEMLMIVTAAEKVPAILAAVNTVPKLCEPGGGIVFTLGVERFIPLGQEAQ
jgi:nitrogen regulatory protein PII